MARHRVTLKANLKHGLFYWVAEVSAQSEEEAVAAAEHLFMAELEDQGEWAFDEFDVEPA